jgi:glycosyltransferase involved in cell wall biosynthesis
VIIKNHYPTENDPRVTKLLRILTNEGYRVTYIGWDLNSSSFFPYRKRVDNKSYEEIIMCAKSPFGYPFFYFPLWWTFGLLCLLRLDWSIVHVVNFPSIFPAILAAKLKKKRVIYDIEDTYIDQLPIKQVRLREVGLAVDRLTMKFVDAVILVDEMQIEEFHGIPNNKVVVIYDTPYPILKPDKNFFEWSDFTIFYAGRLGKGRYLNLDSMIKAVSEIKGVKLIFAGTGDRDLINEINSAARVMPDKVFYLGWVPYTKVLELSLEADLLFSLRDPNPPNQKYICGSKFLEAIMLSKPILVNKETSAAIKVSKNTCGIVVNAHDIKELTCAILELKNNPRLCKTLGLNGRTAYEKEYSWEIAKKRLLQLYYELVSD